MKRQFSILILLMAGVGTAAAQLVSSHAGTAAAPSLATSAPPELQGKPVARVNGAVLTDRDLVREMYTIFPYARQHNGGVPKAMEADIRAGAMKMIEFEELVYQEAQRRKLTVAPERMARAEREFHKQFSSDAEFRELLNGEFKGSTKLLRAKIERSLLIEQMLKTEVEDRSAVSVVQARAFYDKNPDKFMVQESFAVQTISVMPPATASAAQIKEARKKAEDALRQARATKNYDEFGLLAEKISEDDYRVIMGDHRSVERAKLPPQVLQAVLKMQPGQVSDLVDIGNNAYTILRLNAHTPAGEKKFEEVKDSLREQLKKQKSEELRSALDKRLRTKAKVEEL